MWGKMLQELILHLIPFIVDKLYEVFEPQKSTPKTAIEPVVKVKR